MKALALFYTWNLIFLRLFKNWWHLSNNSTCFPTYESRGKWCFLSKEKDILQVFNNKFIPLGLEAKFLGEYTSKNRQLITTDKKKIWTKTNCKLSCGMEFDVTKATNRKHVEQFCRWYLHSTRRFHSYTEPKHPSNKCVNILYTTWFWCFLKWVVQNSSSELGKNLACKAAQQSKLSLRTRDLKKIKFT